MKKVLEFELINQIAKDFELEATFKNKIYQDDFPFKKGKRTISSTFNSIIVDKHGNEFPYMLDQFTRNNDKLSDFDYIYTNQNKNIFDLAEEAGIELRTERCRLDEGGGWYSNGIKVFYKNLYCEL